LAGGVVALIAEDDVVRKYPTTIAELDRWTQRGSLTPTRDEKKNKLFEEETVKALLECRCLGEQVVCERLILDKLQLARAEPKSLWDKLAAIGPIVATVALLFATVQFMETRNSVRADNEYKMVSDLLATRSDLPAFNERVWAARQMHEAKNLSDDTWSRLLTRICANRDDLAAHGNIVADVKNACEELKSQ
jgi:hypothetical protein